jgi:dihydroxyacetone kinase
MSHFINERARLVTESIDGYLQAIGPDKLARLDGFRHTKVLLRQDWDKSRVALISGGGSGHEPSHAGFLGEGMLTAVVCGEVFASPSVDAVLSAICAVTGAPGCLLIVKNYTGDRLNFGLAAEKARQLGHQVELVFVADDIALPEAPHPRGVAGTLLVHKAAGHVAARGGSLAEVRAAAQDVAEAVVSLGLAFDTCTLPGETVRSRLATGQIELGLGIHGEPGARVMAAAGAAALVKTMVNELRSRLPATGALAVLVNNLGGSTPLEMNVLTRELLRSEVGARIELIVGPGPLMTALDMHGASVSLLPLDAVRRERLLSAVVADSWPGVRAFSAPTVLPLPVMAQPVYRSSEDAGRRALITAIGQALQAHEQELNELDRTIGDGDTGTTFATAARDVLAAMQRTAAGRRGATVARPGQSVGQSDGRIQRRAALDLLHRDGHRT